MVNAPKNNSESESTIWRKHHQTSSNSPYTSLYQLYQLANKKQKKIGTTDIPMSFGRSLNLAGIFN